MPRYVPMAQVPLSWGSETERAWQDRPSVIVFERDERPTNTGLVDPSGMAIYRFPDESTPLGFCR